MSGWVRAMEIAQEEGERINTIIDEAIRKERSDIIACIESTTWSGYMEIVDMIKRRGL